MLEFTQRIKHNLNLKNSIVISISMEGIMKRITIFFISFILMALAGCATAPTKQELDNAYYGRVIEQNEAEKIVKKYMSTRLKDPYSAIYDFSIVYKSFYKDHMLEGGKLYTGYQIAVDINAKNSFGGYVGAKSYLFIINDGEVIKAVQLDDSGIHKNI